MWSLRVLRSLHQLFFHPCKGCPICRASGYKKHQNMKVSALVQLSVHNYITYTILFSGFHPKLSKVDFRTDYSMIGCASGHDYHLRKFYFTYSRKLDQGTSLAKGGDHLSNDCWTEIMSKICFWANLIVVAFIMMCNLSTWIHFAGNCSLCTFF